jgi:transketolase
MRRTFVQILKKLMEKNKDIFLLTVDVGFGVLEPLKENFPENFIDIGIGEQNAVGVATGLALKNKIPFVYSINAFLAFRAFEQIKMSASMNQHVILIGVGLDEEYKNQGISHYAYGDKQVLSAIPNLKILTPETKEEVVKYIKLAYEVPGPYYIRLSRFGGRE